MRQRPVRSRIYLPVVRWGVVSSDWKFVLIATLIGYLIPFFLNLRVGRLPMWLFSGLLAACLSYGFFRFVRTGRKPYWLQHTAQALVQSSHRRRSLPADSNKNPQRAWLRQHSPS